MKKDPKLKAATQNVIDNLQALQQKLNSCVNEGMLDEGNAYYNELIDLLDDADIVKTWDELMEIIARAKTLEIDIDAWISIRGGTTISLEWPSIESSE